MRYKDFSYVGFLLPSVPEFGRAFIVGLVDRMSSKAEFLEHLEHCDQSKLEDDEWERGDPEAPASYGDDFLGAYAITRVIVELDRFLVKKYGFVKQSVHNKVHSTTIFHRPYHPSRSYYAFGIPAEGLSYAQLLELQPVVKLLRQVARLELRVDDEVRLVSSAV